MTPWLWAYVATGVWPHNLPWMILACAMMVPFLWRYVLPG